MDQNNKGNQEVDLDSTPEDYGPGVRFEEEWQSPVQTLSPETPKMIQWVIEYSGGYVKDEKSRKLCFDWVCNTDSHNFFVFGF